MSLQVWLPLTKDLRQQGLSNVEVTNNGAVFNSAGKLGGCYEFTSSGNNLSIPANAMNNFVAANGCSLAFWIKINNWYSSYATFFQAGMGSTAWTHYIFGILRNATNSTVCFTISNGSSASNANYLTSAWTVGEWMHVAFTYETGKCKIYLNGNLDKEYTTSIVPNFSKITKITIGRCNNDSSYQTNCDMNDFRLYDHCLSPMEVKELAKGLVLHYLLSDNSIQQLNNCYNYPTFNTSSTSGGWFHWGQSGASGSYGQTTDSQYIYRKGQSYAHWFANDAGATGDYLLYQYPAFEGGKRSVQCICKEENGLPIEESIVRPVWNARSGGAINGKWTSIISLDNDFYYCKCENIQQSGSDDLVGFYIKPGYKVYFSEAYLEDNRDVSSDIFFPTNVVYDCSGFYNNGTAVGTFTILSDTPKYSTSTQFNGTEYILKDSFTSEILTLSAWIKTSKNKSTSQFVVADLSSQICISIYSGCIIGYYGASGSQGIGSRCTLGSSYKENDWNHIVVVKTGVGTRTIYCNGVELTPTSNDYWTANGPGFMVGARTTSLTLPFYGEICDVRAYVTALSADDVKSLYESNKL